MSESKRKIIITFCFVLILFGGIILSYSYVVSKIRLTFDTVNLELYGNSTPRVVNDDNVSNNSDENSNSISTDSIGSIFKKSKYNYIGYLEIPKINLKQGFVSMDSKYNDVERNIQIIKPSSYPNQENSSLIMAAHSGTSSISYFKNLYKISSGDEVYVDYEGIKYKYRFMNVYEVPKTGDVPIYRNPNVKTLTLITCTKNNEETQTVYIAELEGTEAL